MLARSALLAQALPDSWIDRVLGPAGALVLSLLLAWLLVWASAKGLVRWGPSVEETVSVLRDQVAEIKDGLARAEQRAEAVAQENRDLNAFLRNEAVPAMTRVADTLSRAIVVLDRVERERR